ncbi:hypothetical protein FQN51_002395 [Onygenales sp. PD_10]|nr:hypothetical protein FQN51_002395 [Onygenales sp. PD_10]
MPPWAECARDFLRPSRAVRTADDLSTIEHPSYRQGISHDEKVTSVKHNQSTFWAGGVSLLGTHYPAKHPVSAPWKRSPSRLATQLSPTRRFIASKSIRPKELRGNLEWTFIEVPEILNGVSKEQLRTRFKAWAPQTYKTEQPRADPLSPEDWMHHDINENNPLEPELGRKLLELSTHTFVNLVDSDWKPLKETDHGLS